MEEKGVWVGKKKWEACVCLVCVEAMYVFLSELWINGGTAKGEETGLSVGWDGIKGTSMESGVKAKI